MIDFRTGELADLWKEETSSEFKALSYALRMAMNRLITSEIKTGVRWDIDELDEDTLDYLAVELRTMYYDQSADIGTKRNIIKKTLEWYRHAGTVSACEELISSIFGGSSRLIEWFDYKEPPYIKNTFDVETSARMTETIIDDLTAIIRKAKNARSQIRRVTVLRDLHSAATMATHITAINECTVSNHEISDIDATEGMNVAAVIAPVSETYALNTTAGDAQATAGAFIASATGTEGRTYVLNDNQEATEASGTIDVWPFNALTGSAHTVNTTGGEAQLSQSEKSAMRANIDYQTTTVKKEE